MGMLELVGLVVLVYLWAAVSASVQAWVHGGLIRGGGGVGPRGKLLWGLLRTGGGLVMAGILVLTDGVDWLDGLLVVIGGTLYSSRMFREELNGMMGWDEGYLGVSSVYDRAWLGLWFWADGRYSRESHYVRYGVDEGYRRKVDAAGVSLGSLEVLVSWVLVVWVVGKGLMG